MAAEATNHTPPDAAEIEDLIACPHCDALYVATMPAHGGRAVCAYCHTVLIAPKRQAGKKIIALTLAVMILVVAALFFPFLDINASGFGNSTSILDAASSFRSGYMVFLSFLVAASIIFVPLLRTCLILYVLVPIVRDRPALPHARRAFRWSQDLKPWAMAEIFAIGCAVALVKVADLAQIGFGPAFWMFSALVVLVLINDNFLCTWSVWKSLELEED
ncbi:Paraquat-inducible protein A (plasmid) [Roseivivax sp. THAF40]|uniref:paraquat-inducible protein A n=1 Tax=unclassified Roseivivax TaxID=2639302 RepID=UPI0012682F39|nr:MULTISPECIES: paraquat-inducible protein A [unclassified Roseivivax]QFS84970.1 Paraquat-inducible protein A [Roseivivax sp. THAF197b]QFT48671.1 Paraquat-inducible protein A [Roseivivax sp. THAF40]